MRRRQVWVWKCDHCGKDHWEKDGVEPRGILCTASAGNGPEMDLWLCEGCSIKYGFSDMINNMSIGSESA